MANEKEYYLYWDLFELYDIFVPKSDDYYEEEHKETNDPYTQTSLNYPGIYQIYARHPVHGPEALLYMGVATKAVRERLWEHFSDSESQIYLQDEQDVRIRVGRVLRSRRSNRYEDTINERNLRRIEGSLIAYCAPIYNVQHRSSERMTRNIRIFNSGDFGALPGEISHRYHTWR